MKKYVIKATALAIGALVGGAAFASIDFTADPVATTGKFARELNYNSTGTGNQAIGAGQTVTTKLGFGVSATQQRYIRVDLGALKLGAVAAGGNVVNSTATFGAGNVTVVSGGAVGDSFIIYQVTGNAGGHAASDTVVVTLPALRTTAGNAANPTVTYALYETAVAAANNVAGTSLYSTSGTLFEFAAGYKVNVTQYTNTAAVAKAYLEFTANGAAPTTTTVKAEVGAVDVAAAAGVNRGDGTAIALADLFTTSSRIVFKGDFNFTKATTGVVVEAAGCTGALGSTSLSTDKLTATYTPASVAALATPASLCVETAASNTVAIPAQAFTYDFNPAAVSGNTITDPAAAQVGEIVRDGTELQAPFATIHPDYLSRIVLTSQYSLDVAYTLSTITEDGVSCNTGSAATGTLKAGKMVVVNVKDVCSSTTTGATRLAVKATISAPLNKVHGLYNVMNYDQVTGKTNSLISYPMVRPTEN